MRPRIWFPYSAPICDCIPLLTYWKVRSIWAPNARHLHPNTFFLLFSPSHGIEVSSQNDEQHRAENHLRALLHHAIAATSRLMDSGSFATVILI